MASNSISALIVDDEAKSRNILQNLLLKYCPQVNIVGSANSIDDAFSLFSQHHPQLIFLDVEMPPDTGFDLLKRLPTLDFEVIFVTGFDHYAMQAIKFHALDYLLKPVNIDELILAVKKVEVAVKKQIDSQRLQMLLNNLGNPNPGSRQVAIPTAEGRIFIPVEQVLYCQADGKYTWIILETGKKLISTTNLGEYEKILPLSSVPQNHRFFRIHHGYLVNLFFIKRYNGKENYVQMNNGEKINIAQRRKAKFLEVMDN